MFVQVHTRVLPCWQLIKTLAQTNSVPEDSMVSRLWEKPAMGPKKCFDDENVGQNKKEAEGYKHFFIYFFIADKQNLSKAFSCYYFVYYNSSASFLWAHVYKSSNVTSDLRPSRQTFIRFCVVVDAAVILTALRPHNKGSEVKNISTVNQNLMLQWNAI